MMADGLYGSKVGDPNFLLRFSLVVFVGIIAFGAILSWKSHLLFSAEYQEMPVTNYELQKKKQNTAARSRIEQLQQMQQELQQER